MMIPIPAIDLKDGKVVRLLHGDFKEKKVYFDKADVVAKDFEAQGAQRLHVVDLDGALKGKPKNLDSVESILMAVKMPVEVGGGIRSLEVAEIYLKMGASWVILGTKACLDEGFLREALAAFGDKVIVGIDARDGFIATDGWTKVTKTPAVELAKKVRELGGKCLISTDISRDGAMKGPSLKEIRLISEVADLDIIASGGVSSLQDLSNLAALKRTNIIGVIIGKAIYEKKFTLKEAARTCLQNASFPV